MLTVSDVCVRCSQSIIIPLLTNAVSQFKRYKSPRMKRYLSTLYYNNCGKCYITSLANKLI